MRCLSTSRRGIKLLVVTTFSGKEILEGEILFPLFNTSSKKKKSKSALTYKLKFMISWQVSEL